MEQKFFTQEDINDVLNYMDASQYVLYNVICMNFIETIIYAWFHSQDISEDQVDYFEYQTNEEDVVELYYTLK